jgi:hypothetical protein
MATKKGHQLSTVTWKGKSEYVSGKVPKLGLAEEDRGSGSHEFSKPRDIATSLPNVMSFSCDAQASSAATTGWAAAY